jgi:hypothetical protein
MEEFRRLPLPHPKERFPSWRIGNLRHRGYITSMEEFRTLPRHEGNLSFRCGRGNVLNSSIEVI